MILLGGPAEPQQGLLVVLRQALTLRVSPAQSVLGIGIALLGRLAIPFRDRRIVFRYAQPVTIQFAEAGLSRGQPLLGGKTKQPRRLGMILTNAAAIGIHQAKVVLG